MATSVREQERKGVLSLLPLLVDGAAVLIMWLWLPAFAQQLGRPSGWNALLLTALYVLFCVGVYLSRKMIPVSAEGRWYPPAWLVARRVRASGGILFALFMVTTLAFQLGFFESIFQVSAGLLEEGSTAALFVYAPGAWLGFSMLVILVLAFPVNATVAPGRPLYVALALLSLLFCDAMLVFSAAQAQVMFAGSGLASGIGPWLLTAVALIASFLPARAIYQSRWPSLAGWIGFAALLISAVSLAAI
jgi:hypothetical protein